MYAYEPQKVSVGFRNKLKPFCDIKFMSKFFLLASRILRSGSANLNGSARLYRVRGRRPVLVQLEPVSWAQLATDGVFVLDTASLLVLWLGRTANLVEKIFGAKVCG